MRVFKGLKSFSDSNYVWLTYFTMQCPWKWKFHEVLGIIISQWNTDLFPSFREVARILEKSAGQRVSVTEISAVHMTRRGRGDGD